MNPFHPFTHMPARPPSPLSARFNELKAENAELRRKLAAKEADVDDDSPGQDEIDPSDVDAPPPGKPKKGKKTKKDGDDVDKNEDEEEQPARPDEDKPEGPQEGVALGVFKRTEQPNRKVYLSWHIGAVESICGLSGASKR